jgi:hypothetical protein
MFHNVHKISRKTVQLARNGAFQNVAIVFINRGEHHATVDSGYGFDPTVNQCVHPAT